MRNTIFATALLGLLAGTTTAQSVVTVSSNITTSTTWTANNQYSLTTQIYVQNGATLTIEPGTVIGSPTGVGGSLAVAKGSKIIACGKNYAPIIFTSQADINTWDPLPGHPTGGDPKTGVWREAVNEWGNLTLMGCAYIGADDCVTAGNTKTPGNNVSDMEGLIANPMFPGRNQYGGTDDSDDSGSLCYISLRYGGRVIALNNELNGLSMGGIGRETDVHHIEIMNNVDDGIETWGGCVSYKYVSIWNIGDDSMDVDQGWRGNAQFGLIVQGFSANANQGSGVGDNCFEMDGAEQSDAQPVTTATVYNWTVIGQPGNQAGPFIEGGDHAMAFRDNDRTQYRNMVFCDIGDDLVRFDNVDGDPCGTGYGFNGTLTWAATWNTNWNATPAHPNDPASPLKNAHFSGNLIEVTDSCFFNINDVTEATARGVLPGTVVNNNVLAGSCPITSIVRAPGVNRGGKFMQQVTFLDPTPTGGALTSASFAPWRPGDFKNPSILEGAHFKGGFRPGGNLWTGCWTASAAYGFTPVPAWEDLGSSTVGFAGSPNLSADIPLNGTTPTTFTISDCLPGGSGFLFLDFWLPPSPIAPACTDNRLNFTFFSVNLVSGSSLNVPTLANGSGVVTLPIPFVPGFPGLGTDWQYLGIDPAGPFGVSASNAITSYTLP